MGSSAVLEISAAESKTRRHTEVAGLDSSKRGCSCTGLPAKYLKELKNVMSFGIPLIVIQATQLFIYTISMIFCGRLSKTEFDGAILANVVINSFGLSVATGLSTACDTLFAQIYGSPNRQKLGTVLIRSLLFLALSAFIPIAFFINADHFLILLGQEAEISKLAGKYLVIFCPGLFAYFIYMPLSKYLHNQNIIIPTLIIGVIANAVNIGLHLLLVVHANYGITGSAVAQASSYMSYPLLTIAFIMIFKVYEDTWTGWTTECLLNWSQLFWLGWFGLVMICIEWWSYEVGIILAGLLGSTELASQSVIMQISTYNFVLYLGLGLSVNIRVGRFLGANNPKGAITSFRIALVITGLLSLLFSGAVYSLRNLIPQIFTNIPEVIDMTASVLPWYAICSAFEGTFIVCGGILRGTGRQNIGSLVTFIAYMSGLAIAIPVLLKTRSLAGYWKGMAVALSADAVVLLIILIRTNWEKQTKQTIRRVSNATLRMEGTEATVSMWVYIRRALSVVAVLGVLSVSILVRIYVPTKDSHTDVERNSTDTHVVQNSTLANMW